MSSVWRELPDRTWQALTIPAGRSLHGGELGLAGIQLCDLPAERGAVLLVRPAVWVRVNGQPVLGGLRVLEHKDEILLAQARLFFSVEATPIVVLYRVPEGGRAPICPICRGPIKDGVQAVQCPGCGRWFHQIDAAEGRPAKPCWTYTPTCRFCSHPTVFGAESAWRPEKEDAHV